MRKVLETVLLTLACIMGPAVSVSALAALFFIAAPLAFAQPAPPPFAMENACPVAFPTPLQWNADPTQTAPQKFTILTCVNSQGQVIALTGWTTAVDATQLGVKASTQLSWNCTWSNGSPTITCPAGTFTQNNTGQGIIAFGTNGPSAGFVGQISSVVTCPQSTITMVSSSVATLSNNCTSNAVGPFIWGPDDTVAVQNAAQLAANNCTLVLYPAGNMLIQSSVNPTVPTNCTNSTESIRGGYGVRGVDSSSTRFIVTPSFSMASCTQNNACFFSPSTGQSLQDFAIWGAGNSTLGTAGKFILNVGTLGGTSGNQRLQNVIVMGWGAGVSNFIGIQFGSGVSQATYVQSDGAGGIACQVNNTLIGFSFGPGNFCGDTLQQSLFMAGAGTILNSFGNSWGPNGSASCDVGNLVNAQTNFFGDTVHYGQGHSGAGSGAMCFAGTGLIEGVTILDNSPSGGTSVFVNAGGVLHAHNSVISQAGAGATALSISGTFMDEGGNKITTVATNVFPSGSAYVADGHSAKGTCTGVVTPSSTLGLYGTGPNVTATTCTSVTIGSGIQVQGARTLQNLVVSATAGGVNASSGVVTVLKNGSPTSLTCTIGTATFCSDGLHSVSAVDGDLISIQFTTQAADTLAGVKAIVPWN